MDRRTFLTVVGSLAGSTCLGLLAGCRGHQFGHVFKGDEKDLVGSHAAGAEVFNPLIEEAVAKLLSRHSTTIQEVTYQGAEVLPTKRSICFVGVENKSIEELGDFKDQIYQQIDTMLVQSEVFQPVSRRVMDAALRETRLASRFAADSGEHADVRGSLGTARPATALPAVRHGHVGNDGAEQLRTA